MTDPAIPAATLVVMRDRQSAEPELLTVTRGRNMAFAGGAVAFPGGRLDTADRALAGPDADELAAWKIAAIRETLEETAIAAGFLKAPPFETAAALQRRLHQGGDFGTLLGEYGLELDLSALTPFSRWKPAFAQPRTFDTIFFLAAAPDGNWMPLAQEGECEAAEWVGAAALLERIDRGDAHAIFPTKRNLERLALLGSLAEATAHAAAYPFETITPWVEEREGERLVCIPEDRGYPVTSEPLATAFRA